MLGITSIVSGHLWIDMILSIESYFDFCFNSRSFLNNLNNYENITLLYKFQNSSKFISKKHLILYENFNCCMRDDEDNKLSCLINDRHRVKCLNKSKCLSSLHTFDDCPFNENQLEKKISFQNICDGLGEFFVKIQMMKFVQINLVGYRLLQIVVP
ncbi:unnamed protein product [Rotaria sp. Silwood2]|nr:unnamed protein product [Rotaria sp. Silwood2]CAF4472940.1 unnamed protein product [Rotaria sp. Silwood2]